MCRPRKRHLRVQFNFIIENAHYYLQLIRKLKVHTWHTLMAACYRYLIEILLDYSSVPFDVFEYCRDITIECNLSGDA